MRSCLISCWSTLLWTLLVIEGVLPVVVNPQSKSGTLSSTSLEMEFPGDNEENIQDIATIIDALENLNVLDGRKLNCYTLDKIVKTKEPDESGGSNGWKVGIFLHVREIAVGENGLPVEAGKKGQETGGVSSGLYPTENVSDAGGPACIGAQGVNGSVPGLGDGGNSTIPPGEVSGNATGLGGRESGPGVGKDHQKLSHTQVVVISTCSVVIGVFFIVALSLRIRNYLKRLRQDGRLPRRSVFRSVSVGMTRGSTQSDLNKDSGAPNKIDATGHVTICIDKKKVKVPAPPKVTVNSQHAAEPHGYYESHSQHNSHEVKPLLVITSASAPSSPTFNRKGSHGREGVRRSQTEDHALTELNFTQDHNFDETPAAEYIAMTTADDAEQDDGVDLEETINITASPDNSYESEKLGEVEPKREVTQNALQKQTSETRSDTDVIMENSATDFESGFTEANNDWSMYSIGSAGISQSDSSLNSTNPSYCYGNQTEYTSGASYEDYGEPIDDATACVPEVIVTSSSDPELLDKDAKDNEMVNTEFESGCGSETAKEDELSYGDYVNQNYEADSPLCDCNVAELDSETPLYTHNSPKFNNRSWRHADAVIDDDAFCQSNADQDIQSSKGCPRRSSSLKRNTSDGQNLPRKSVTFSLDLTDHNIEDLDTYNAQSDDSDPETTASNACSEKTFLLGEEFEGMEPTYV